MAVLKSAKLDAALDRLKKKIGKGAVMRVGWFPDDLYPDGTPVAFVAATQEYGAPRASIPPRPFFRTMIAEKQDTWANNLRGRLQYNGWDADEALERLGDAIVAQLQQSIIKVNSPPLSPITLMLRYMKKEDQSLIVTGATVGEAARRVAAGEVPTGISTKPLEDTKLMLMTVRSEVTPT